MLRNEDYLKGWRGNLQQDDPRRAEFLSHAGALMKKLVGYAPVDAAVDQKARDFMHDCLPPMLTPGNPHALDSFLAHFENLYSYMDG